MARVTVEFEVEVPEVRHTEQELLDWLRYEFGDNGSLREDNPLLSLEVTPVFGSFQVY